jgi:hypothetical protein
MDSVPFGDVHQLMDSALGREFNPLVDSVPVRELHPQFRATQVVESILEWIPSLLVNSVYL